MDERNYALLGVIGPLTAYVFTGMSVMLSPWFSWRGNALSDLGHAVKSGVAPIFNLGLLVAGFLILVYAITAFRKYAKYTSICLTVSVFMLQTVATFNEVYGFLHYAVSVLFFISLGITSIVYTIEKKAYLTIIALIIGFSSWILYWARVYSAGVAVPEIISSTAAVSWIILSAFSIYFNKQLLRWGLPKEIKG